MPLYTVVLTKSAEKDLRKLPSKVADKVVVVLQSLQDNPRPEGCKKLKGYENLWRFRIGDYRIIYAISDVILLVDVCEIGYRKDIYDKL